MAAPEPETSASPGPEKPPKRSRAAKQAAEMPPARPHAAAQREKGRVALPPAESVAEVNPLLTDMFRRVISIKPPETDTEINARLQQAREDKEHRHRIEIGAGVIVTGVALACAIVFLVPWYSDDRAKLALGVLGSIVGLIAGYFAGKGPGGKAD